MRLILVKLEGQMRGAEDMTFIRRVVGILDGGAPVVKIS